MNDILALLIGGIIGIIGFNLAIILIVKIKNRD